MALVCSLSDAGLTNSSWFTKGHMENLNTPFDNVARLAVHVKTKHKKPDEQYSVYNTPDSIVRSRVTTCISTGKI